MHPTEGQLRAYQDQELPADEQAQVQQHLDECAACHARALTLARRAAHVGNALAALTPQAEPLSARRARARLDERLSTSQEESPSMLNRLFRSYRPAWAALAAVLVVVTALAFPPVRALAADFLGLFRVQRISVVTIDPTNLEATFDSSARLEELLANNVKMEPLGEGQEATDAAEASQLAGIPVRLPTAVKGEAQPLMVNGGARLTFDVDLPLVRAVLDDMGRTDIQLPEGLNGATVTAEIPASVQSIYGDCSFQDERDEGAMGDCTSLMQMASPTIAAPPDLNIAQIGEAFLQLLGMSREEAARFSQKTDWATTLVVPIPYNGVSHREVQVDGVAGTLFVQELEDNQRSYMLLWVKDGVVYALSGPGVGDNALAIADSLQ